MQTAHTMHHHGIKMTPYIISFNQRALILNTDLAQVPGQWRLSPDAAPQHISDAASYGVLGCYWRRIFSLTGKTRLVCGALCWSVISIADAGFCRRQFQQTQGSPRSDAWLKCNSGAWEIHRSRIMLRHSKSLFFAQVCCTSSCTRSLALPLAHKYTQGLDPHGGFFNSGAEIVSKLPAALIFCRYSISKMIVWMWRRTSLEMRVTWIY